ncbi:uncharacterized protein LOC121390635 [Gigantopelta aegis]|uniref:uncharacterized protein LOC121390635 n=1 Tax=Gigantopelta aegis TaxID=1735272 RepID=UPI001B887C02|nr:uncharacterized protein LOC121390635 [Gigantopelta aegis]
MLTAAKRRELETKGYTVLHNVISCDDCDKYRSQFDDWLTQFKDGDWPISSHSLIQRYRAGHMEPTWAVRLQAKAVFAQLWETNELLSSFDAIAIGRPPEDGEEEFSNPDKHWLHCDQSVARVGLHAYQGGVYLEDAEEDDWTLAVLEGSHKLHLDFFEAHPKARMRITINAHYTLKDSEVEWYTRHARVARKRVPVPKGGMVLWDSRLIHANARPIKGRRNPGRWRYVVFVCMAPEVWASKEYIKAKQRAFWNLSTTSHWPCDGIQCFSDDPINSQKVKSIQELPESAKTDDAKRLAGVLPYRRRTVLWGSGTKSADIAKPEWAVGSQEWRKQQQKYHLSKWSFMAFGVFLGAFVCFLLSVLM